MISRVHSDLRAFPPFFLFGQLYFLAFRLAAFAHSFHLVNYIFFVFSSRPFSTMFSSAADAGPYARGPRRASTLPDINTNMGDMDDSTTATESPLESDAGLSPTNGQSSDIYPVRRRATAVFAKDWQLRVLKSLYLQTARPSEEQKRVAAMETGL